MSDSRQLGYIAVSRSIFEHPLFKDRPDWLVAWEKLFAAAAWKPQAHVGRWGSAHVERGQLAITQRALAATWGWPPSTVRYFLNLLEQAKMIVQQVVRARINANESIKNSQRITIITICNYDKFQPRGRVKYSEVAQGTAQRVAQESPELPLDVEEVNTNKAKQSRLSSYEATRGRRSDHKPYHGAPTRDGKMRWFDYGTVEWSQYAEDFRKTKGSDKFPESRLEGKGNWFVYAGEATRSKKGGRPRKSA